MNALVVYYSRTGENRKAAEYFAKELGASIEEIRTKENLPKKKTVNICIDMMLRKKTDIMPANDPSKYDLVLLVTPTWIGKTALPMDAYIKENRRAIKSAAFFSVSGSGGDQNVFKSMKKTLGKTPVATLSVKSKTDYSAQLEAFAKKLKQ